MDVTKLPKTGSQGEYKKVSAEDKAKVADYASKNSVSAAIRHFKHTASFEDLMENIARGWKNAYCSKIAISRKRGSLEPDPISAL